MHSIETLPKRAHASVHILHQIDDRIRCQLGGTLRRDGGRMARGGPLAREKRHKLTAIRQDGRVVERNLHYVVEDETYQPLYQFCTVVTLIIKDDKTTVHEWRKKPGASAQIGSNPSAALNKERLAMSTDCLDSSTRNDSIFQTMSQNYHNRIFPDVRRASLLANRQQCGDGCMFS